MKKNFTTPKKFEIYLENSRHDNDDTPFAYNANETVYFCFKDDICNTEFITEELYMRMQYKKYVKKMKSDKDYDKSFKDYFKEMGYDPSYNYVQMELRLQEYYDCVQWDCHRTGCDGNVSDCEFDLYNFDEITRLVTEYGTLLTAEQER